jgi:ribonuclease R
MLPEQLSGHMCSLVPDEDRLAMVVRIDSTPAQRGRQPTIARRSSTRARGSTTPAWRPRSAATYAASAASTSATCPRCAPWTPSPPACASAVASAGRSDLDLPEVVVELDRDDPRLVRDIRRSRKDPGERRAYSMIEEFMLAANEAVAASFQRRGEATIWRIHDAPDTDKLEEFATLAERYGIAIDVESARTPSGLQRVLERLRGHPAEKALSFQLLRSLKQASYEVVNMGHFGLASPAYVHFTSPIRRYPDLVAHRLLKHRLAAQGKPAGGFARLEGRRT